MRTRSRHRYLACVPLIVGALMTASCDGSTPTPPSSEMSFLSGAWNGTLTITRTGEADVSGPVTFTFDVIPQSNRQSLNLRIQSSNSWLPVTATSIVALTPSPEPPGRIGGTGSYTSPRGCVGDFVVLADAVATSLDGTFTGADCMQGLGRVVFDGTIHLTKR
jgi:hypothetical protein